MGLLTKGLLLVAVVVPVTAYLASSLASPTGPRPTDHSPVILRDAPTDTPQPVRTPTPETPVPTKDGPTKDGPARNEPAEVVTPQPTPIGEDDDDEWDDDPDDPDDDREDDDTETEQDDD
ncbi:hypothetical protein SAMN04489844_3173 [Nocardioides exalbidus]|uniref:Uncharacterized protein n=1 Tax=Nocardioides exalbidus TaxID=402596 RepID=A0A1H4W3L0_9ACTN|nr:hypothetical protein [Nocardioides exalbidus]SEC87907.1 hypothetical protein SAMN04489844_3173 [Nocardioides exalbidus]